MCQSLKPGGKLVIDYLNVRYAEQNQEGTGKVEVEDVVFHISKWNDESHFYKQIQATDAQHKSPKHLNTERVAKFTLSDFTEMLSYQGMQVQEVLGIISWENMISINHRD